MVSVSRRASPEHLGQVVFTNEGTDLRGDSPVGLNSTPRGNSTGRSFSGTGFQPHFSQWIMGMGAPQYRWREMSQSRRRKVTALLPIFFSSSHSAIFFLASATGSPFRKSELINFPSSVY